MNAGTGLSESVLATLRAIFQRYPEIERVRLYGSRAMGRYRPNSDIDLVAFGDSVNYATLAAVLLDIDDSDIPFLVDFQAWNDLRNRKLREHIERVGVNIYSRDV